MSSLHKLAPTRNAGLARQRENEITKQSQSRKSDFRSLTELVF